MRRRQDITEMFSTFIQLEQDNFSRWLVDNKLHGSMQRCLDNLAFVSKQEDFWALYWHEHWRLKSSNLARMHMQAYLQEPCYFVSQKTSTLLKDNYHSMADFFQMANAEIEKVIFDFNPQKSSSLKAYFTMAIKSRLRDILRQRKEADICSNWALLRKISKKLLVEALENVGLSTKQISQYRLAWTCFKQLYVQNQSRASQCLTEPTSQLWQAIANLYNDSRYQLSEPIPQSTAQIIEQWLNQSANYVRAYLFPRMNSLDTFNTDSDANQTFDISDTSSRTAIVDMIASEEFQARQNQISQMFGVLFRAFQALDIKSQEILKLYYQQELTQQRIVQQLQISQPMVSRKLVKSRGFLLEALVKWSLEKNISVNPNQLKDMSIALEEWLRNQFKDFYMNP